MEKESIQPVQKEMQLEEQKPNENKPAVVRQGFSFQPAFVGALAEEIAKSLINRMPKMMSKKEIPSKKPVQKKIENPIFLDTSAIIDGRIFDLINMGVFTGTFVVGESILLELKHIADNPDPLRKERGKRGLDLLEKAKKNRKAKIIILTNLKEKKVENEKKKKEVDEQLIDLARSYKGKLITCDYNLEKKASIHGVIAINMHTMAQHLKVQAIPGQAVQIKILHTGKDTSQGVGYLDDGTMLVIEKGSEDIGKTLDVIVSRVLQTSSGRILFAKKA